METQAVLLTNHTALLQAVADDLAGRGLTFFSSARPPAATEHGVPGLEGILRQAISRGIIKASAVPHTELLEMTMTSEKQKEAEAKTIVDSFLRNYVARWAADRNQADNQNLGWLETRRAEVLKKIQDTRVRLQALAGQYGTAAPGSHAGAEGPRPDLWSADLVQLKLEEELYEKLCRRIQQMEVERDYPPRTEAAYWADVTAVVDHRWQWTAIVVGATVLLSVILLIVRRVIRPRPPIPLEEKEKV